MLVFTCAGGGEVFHSPPQSCWVMGGVEIACLHGVFSLSCDCRRACCGIQQRGPFFSEVLAFNVKMEETSEGQRELLFLFTKRCYRDGKFVPYTCSKRQYWPDQCYGWCRKTLNPSKRCFLCPDVGVSARPGFQV